MGIDILEVLQRAITTVGTIGLLGFCLYLFVIRKGA
ncbi:MAG: hypothetical protein K0S45_3358 [Nitrospira sp.]|jgi:hypothetical protein|nr:hypothetical protein [Nitrospira sp.]